MAAVIPIKGSMAAVIPIKESMAAVIPYGPACDDLCPGEEHDGEAVHITAAGVTERTSHAGV